MTVDQAVFSGIAQGITEFFPVSSSGHLVILQALFGISEPQLAFDIFLHVGTLVAIVIFFARDILMLFTIERKTLIYLIIATIPAFIIGFFFEDFIEKLFAAPQLVGIMLVMTGTWLIAATMISAYLARRDIEKPLNSANSLLIGIAQAIAIIPGISRSGATIATGMLAGLNRELAFRFAFLLSIPAVGGACALKIYNIKTAIVGKEAFSFAVGGLTAMIVGLGTIGLLLKLVKQNRLYVFGVYCIVVGIAVVWFLK